MPSPVDSVARRRAYGAILALATAALGQFVLEWSRLRAEPADLTVAVPLLIIGAILAVLATRGRDDHFDGASRFTIRFPGWRWLLALLPGFVFLAWTTAVIGTTPDRIVLSAWLSGIGWFLLVGLAHWGVVSGPRWRPPADFTQVVVMGAVLLFVALALRAGGDLTRLPNFSDTDEVTIGLAARGMAAQPFAWIGVFWVGMSKLTVAPFRAAQVVFGDDLWGFRMGAAMIGTASVLATFGFARRIIGNLPAFTGALLLATAHTHVHWSRCGHEYIETPAAAAIVVWLLARAWTGGSLLSWVGAGIALGLGTQTYWASYALPPLVLVTAVGWAFTTRTDWKAAAVMTAVVAVIALLILAPVGRIMSKVIDPNANRPQSLSLLNPANLETLGPDKMSYFVDHLRDALLMFNTGVDTLPNYRALRSLVDPVTATLVPIAVFMLAARLWGPLGWLCLTWWGTFMLISVILPVGPPSYHRIPGALPFACVGVGWAFAMLMRAVRDGFGLPRASVAWSCLLLAAAAGVANTHFYFYEYSRTYGLTHTGGYSEIVCSYAGRMPVVDAAEVEGRAYIPQGANSFITLACPDVKRIHSIHPERLWHIGDLTDAPEVALIAPTELVEAVPGVPKGYRVKRHYIDERITYPAPLSVSVYELEREGD